MPSAACGGLFDFITANVFLFACLFSFVVFCFPFRPLPLIAQFPSTYRRLVPYVQPKLLIAGLRMTHGLMDAADPDRVVAPQYRTEKYQFREGDFAPSKTFSLLAKVNGKWVYFPKKIVFLALGVKPDVESSTSEPDFYGSSDDGGDSGDEGAMANDELAAEDGRPRHGGAAEPEAAAGWCVIS